MRKVPKRNISSLVSDIFHSRKREDAFSPLVPQEDISRPPTRKLFIGFAALALLAGGVSFYFYYHRELTRLQSAAERVETLGEVLPGNAILNWRTAEGASPLDQFLFVVKNAGKAYENFDALYRHSTALGEAIVRVRDEWPELIFAKKGDELIAILKGVQEHIIGLQEVGGRFLAQSGGVQKFLPFEMGDYVALRVELNRVETFLDAFIPWFESDEEHRVLVMLQNPSEIRPTGGFLGSYAEVVIRKGNVERVEVHDINDADRALEENIVPPKSLQLIAKRWRAADANWFFDFEKSASKVASLLEQSGLYEERGIQFDGVFAITPKTISDLLLLTGPIELASGGTALDQNNFLTEIQKEVQSGQAKKLPDPKKILQELAPRLIERFREFGLEKRSEVFLLARSWFQEKDVMLFFKNPVFERFFDVYGLTGTLTNPGEEAGGYLAVVNANIDGGKTDLFVKQSVALKSQIERDGTVKNTLTILREHRGDKSSFWWYKLPNQSYVRVFVPSASQLVSAKGGIEKKVKPKVDYVKLRYAVDPDVQAVESTEKGFLQYPALSVLHESGRRVFATWFTTLSGKKSEVSLEYTHRMGTAPAPGLTYRFVFEKQAGVDGEYRFEIAAPVGFRFRENGLPVYEYTTNDPPGRLLIDLTFEQAL